MKTSIWYGHRKAKINEIKGEELLKTQHSYLSKCYKEYNLSNCLYEKDSNGKSYLIYDFIEGENLTESKITSKSDLFLKMIPSLLTAISKYPHGDLSFENLILHYGNTKFSIIDPAITYEKFFFTNTNYYPLVPPLFYSTRNGYATFADQLAVGLMLYISLTGVNPLNNLTEFPFWANEFGNSIGGSITDDIYSTISIIPESWGYSFNFSEYFNAVKNQLKLTPNNFLKQDKSGVKSNTGEDIISWTEIINHQSLKTFPLDFFEIKPPKQLNHFVSQELSDFCMSLIFNYEPIEYYINKIQQLTALNRH